MKIKTLLKIQFSIVAVIIGIGLTAVVNASRNASGTYTRPSNTTAVSGQVISSARYNDVLTDLETEITDSLSRSGKGPMTAPLECTNGTNAAPSITFDSDPDTGFYRIGADNIGMTLGGTKIFDYGAAYQRGPDGSESAPGLSFTGDTNTGIYRSGADTLGIAVGGATSLSCGTTGIYVGQSGSSGAPSISFVSDTNTGVYRAAADTIALAAGSVNAFQCTATTCTSNVASDLAGAVTVTAAAPAKTDAVAQTSLTQISFAKAWGYVETDGSPVIKDGLNIATFSATGAGANNLQVTFADAMADANYAVVLSADNYNVCTGVTDRQTTGFEITAATCDGGVVQNLQSTTYAISFMVIGR